MAVPVGLVLTRMEQIASWIAIIVLGIQMMEQV